MKPQHASQRVVVPEGFSGWWCERCEKPVAIEDTLGSPARCPKCHKPTAVWIPPGLGGVARAASDLTSQREVSHQRTKRQPAGRALEWEMAGAEFVRKRPRSEDAARLFEHIHAVMENPGLNPDLRQIEDEEARR